MSLRKFQLAYNQSRMCALMVIACLLPACGGGGSDSSSGAESTAIPQGFARFSGTVNDNTGTPLSGADVRVPFGNTLGWAGTTDASGKYSFDARASDYGGVSPVAVVISKDGYRPRTIYYTNINSNAVYAFTSDASTSPAKLATNEVVPKNSAGLWHVGNDLYGGAVNSQLQTSSRGDGLVFEVNTWTADLKAKYRSVTLQFSARGVDPQSCRDAFGLGAGSVAPFQYITGSDPNGNFTNYRLTLDVSTIAIGTPVVVFARSGACLGSSDPLDDFEFTEVLLTFNS